LWYEDGHVMAVEYLSAYLMEWSLSINNIFVFILIFTFFGIKPSHYARVLLIGILMAIILRIIFITVGIELIQRFHSLLYVFGIVLPITGSKMFAARGGEEENLESNKVYKLLKRFLPLVPGEEGGQFTVLISGRRYFTSIFVVVVMLATTDIVS